MKHKHFLNGSLILMAAAAEMASGGGGPAASEAPAADSAQQTPPAETKPPGVIARAITAMRGAESLSAENLGLKQQLATAQARIQQLETENQGLQAKVTGFESEMQQLADALEAEKQETRSVDLKAAQKVAAVGITQTALPAPDAEPAETRESLQAKIAAETDDQKKWDLLEKLEALDAPKK